ncbi:MAG TPA: hypothetical protein VK645_19995 [Chitinophagaceae bacterium]|nr:hypothetical protein [Chitinophagaceae bacterium]
MAKPSIELVEALRETACRLKTGAHYAWGHHGACNCGHLLQVITRLGEAEILTYAHTGTGEWTEITAESCAVTGAPVGFLLSKLEAAGLTPTDIHNIEYLDNKEVLQYLPAGFRWLKKNIRQDVIDYLEAFAELLEEKLLQEMHLYRESFVESKWGSQVQEPVLL